MAGRRVRFLVSHRRQQLIHSLEQLTHRRVHLIPVMVSRRTRLDSELERLLMMAQTVEMISVSKSNSSRLRFLVREHWRQILKKKEVISI